jgi:hypothetical protein
MSTTTFTLTLDKPARKSGGDRYATADGNFSIYVPQSISRPNGQLVQTIDITLTTKETS